MIISSANPGISIETALSLFALLFSFISIVYTFYSDRKVRKLEIIEEATHNILITEFPIILNEMLLSRDDENVLIVLEFLSKNKNRIAFLKYYDNHKYNKASDCFQKLEDEISVFGNNDENQNTTKIETLTKELIKILHK